MKKFSFTLSKVMSLKKQQLDVLKNEMSSLQNDLKKIDEQRAENKRLFSERDLQMQEEYKIGITPLEIMGYKTYFHKLSVQDHMLLEQRKKCESLIAAKQLELIQMKSDIAGLEKLEEKQLDEYRKMLTKDQERTIEEFVSQATYIA